MTSKKLIAGAIFAILILAVANQVSAQNFSINITSPSQQNVQLVAGQRVDVQWQIQGTAPTAGNYRVQYCYRSTQCDEAKDWKTIGTVRAKPGAQLIKSWKVPPTAGTVQLAVEHRVGSTSGPRATMDVFVRGPSA